MITINISNFSRHMKTNSYQPTKTEAVQRKKWYGQAGCINYPKLKQTEQRQRDTNQNQGTPFVCASTLSDPSSLSLPSQPGSIRKYSHKYLMLITTSNAVNTIMSYHLGKLFVSILTQKPLICLNISVGSIYLPCQKVFPKN